MNTAWCLFLHPLGINSKRQEVTRVGTWTPAEQARMGLPRAGQGKEYALAYTDGISGICFA